MKFSYLLEKVEEYKSQRGIMRRYHIRHNVSKPIREIENILETAQKSGCSLESSLDEKQFERLKEIIELYRMPNVNSLTNKILIDIAISIMVDESTKILFNPITLNLDSPLIEKIQLKKTSTVCLKFDLNHDIERLKLPSSSIACYVQHHVSEIHSPEKAIFANYTGYSSCSITDRLSNTLSLTNNDLNGIRSDCNHQMVESNNRIKNR